MKVSASYGMAAALLLLSLAAGWFWLAVLMARNAALSLCYYSRVLEPLYLGPRSTGSVRPGPVALRLAPLAAGIGTVGSGVLPRSWVALASHAAVRVGHVVGLSVARRARVVSSAGPYDRYC